jgi:protein TonB
MSASPQVLRGRSEFRHSRANRRSRPKPIRSFREWANVPVAGTPLQATTGHPSHIKRWAWVALFVAAVAIHSGAAWFLDSVGDEREIAPRKAELNIELVRPPKPEPPKPEPPKVQPPKPRPVQAQVLPQIQQSDPLPSTVGESAELPVAAAAVVSEPVKPAPEPALTLPVGHAGYLNNPEPDYPSQAVRQGWQGTVLLRVQVLANGTAGQIEVKKSSGRKVLDDSALNTVKRWAFSPAKRGDTPIDYWYTLPIEFLL